MGADTNCLCVFVDGIAQRADLVVAGSENNHNVIMRLPAPLGQKMEVNVIFKIPKPVSQPSTTNVPTIIVEHEKREGKRKSPSGDRLDETSDRPRDQVNMAEGEPERRVIEVRYTTTKATADNENEAKEKVGSCTVIMPNETSYLVTNSPGGAPRD
ncbi:hypothetical protein LSH36_42g08023 [Paralvinella palmiformis]|uniref:Uncharacterized protein n=1 Tax=Paralvinella palmiformis TaxID=53620 RepID=A0AAD9K8R2_9ANNE|nr:hypothetical protein LSH36_42g08023 [Paralvinella palmiformis]